jgi:hypothetical protein
MKAAQFHKAATKYVDAPNRRVDVGGTPFAYRELGTASGVPGHGGIFQFHDEFVAQAVDFLAT